MLRCVSLGFLVLSLAACGPVVNGNATYVSVGPVWSDGNALPFAEQHCGQYSRTPRLKYFENRKAYFDCIKPPT